MPKRAEVILYAEDGWDTEKIVAIVELKQSIKEYAFIMHDSDLDENNTLKKPHFHLYLGFGNTNVKFEHIAAWFNTNRLTIKRKAFETFLDQLDSV